MPPGGETAEEKASGVVQWTPLTSDKGPNAIAVQGVNSPGRQAVTALCVRVGERGSGLKLRHMQVLSLLMCSGPADGHVYGRTVGMTWHMSVLYFSCPASARVTGKLKESYYS